MPGPAFLRGDRIALCTIEEEDAEFLQETINDPDVWGSLATADPVSGHEEREWIEQAGEAEDRLNLLVCSEGDPAGSIGLHDIDPDFGTAEVGYYVAPEYQGRGYATEAVDLLVGFAFDRRRLHRISARVYEGNEASRRVLEKVGFTREGVLRDGAFLEGEYRDVHVFGLLAEEWRE